MNITPIIFFDMVAAILILALCLVVIVIYLVRVTKTLHASLEMKDEAFRKNANLLDEARIKAVRIIDDANNQALDIVSKVTLSSNAASETFKQDLSRISLTQIKEFEKATSDFIALYSKILQDLRIKNVEVFQNASKAIEVNTMAEIENFKESMQKLTVVSQKEVGKKIDSDYENAKGEIEAYKKEELQKIDLGVYELLEKLGKMVLGKALNLSEHEDLIEKSLEKAKIEGAFKE